MAFAPPAKAKVSSNLAKSTWTPMNHPEANHQVFEERRELIKKWFQKWQETQKRIIVDDILKSLSNKHLVSLNETLNGKFPQEKHDFTRILPRVLTLYLFSFLDPRTLCRCAQVSWYWNYLSEMDCLWRPKCLRFGWYPTYQPSPFEEKVWKRFYVSTVHELNFVKAKSVEAKHDIEEVDRPDTGRSVASKASVARSHLSSASGLKKGPSIPSTKKPLSGPKWQPPPWRGSDPRPIDTVRYNYLDNMSKDKKRSSLSLTGRPSSRHGARPQSAVGRSRHHKTDDGSNFSLLKEDESSSRSHNPALEKTSRLSGDVLTNYSGTAGTVPSPRLNKDFQLPQYNGNHLNATNPTMSLGGMNSSLQYGNGYPPVTSQINWSPQQDGRTSYERLTNGNSNPLRLTQRPSSVTGIHNQGSEHQKSSYPAADFARLSVDAGVRPQPVSKLTPDKVKHSKERIDTPSDKKVTPAKHDHSTPTANTEDLKGNAWKSPANINSDDDDF